MTSVNLLRFSAPECHPQRFFQIKGIHAQPANLGMHHSHWNDYNIKIHKFDKNKFTIF